MKYVKLIIDMICLSSGIANILLLIKKDFNEEIFCIIASIGILSIAYALNDGIERLMMLIKELKKFKGVNIMELKNLNL